MVAPMRRSIHDSVNRHFINQNPVTLVIKRESLVSDGAGGQTAVNKGEVATVIGRIVGNRNWEAGQVRTVPDGIQVTPSHSLVFEKGVDIRIDDYVHCPDTGEDFRITFVSDSPPWRKTAEASYA